MENGLQGLGGDDGEPKLKAVGFEDTRGGSTIGWEPSDWFAMRSSRLQLISLVSMLSIELSDIYAL